jgi:menaquinone-dependent protoporphyrinogen oxidase
MTTLVAYASRHGATRGIAERIGNVLACEGIEARVEPVEAVDRVDGYDAFVVGSAVYLGEWLGDATTFVRLHQDLLASRPVWLFSSGPVGPGRTDDKGRDVLELSRPRDFEEFADSIGPRDERVFFGAYDPDAEPIGVVERLGAVFARWVPDVREALPAGDFREWSEIDAWAQGIARELRDLGVGTSPTVAGTGS